MFTFIRRFILILLATSLLCGFAMAAEENSPIYDDITGHWAESNITAMAQRNVLRSRFEGMFQPDEPITRAEFVDMLVKTYVLRAHTEHAFNDTSYHWAKESIETAFALSLVQGVSSTHFAPDAFLTREQMVTLLMRVSELTADEPEVLFSDTGRISSWASDAVSIATSRNLIHGYPSGEFLPKKYTTRAEAVVVLQNVVHLAPYTSFNSKVYTSAGTYGPSDSQEVVGGRVTITTGDVLLQNMLIHGDLIIDKAVGEGQVTLHQVTVKGNTYIQGGGSKSVYLFDTQLGMVYIQKDDKPVRVVVGGTSEIQKILAETSAIFEEADLTGGGIYGIIASPLENGNIFLQLKGVQLERLDILTEGVEIITDENTVIQHFSAEAATSVQGFGSIINAQIQANGVHLNTKPTEITIQEGIAEPVYPPPPVEEEVVYLTYLTSLQPFSATPQVGVPLNAGTYQPAEASVLYQWWVCNEVDGVYVPLSGASSASYTPTSLEEGMYLKVSISGYGNFAGYVISTPSAAVLSHDSSPTDTAALLAARASLEEALGSIFLERDVDINVAAKAQSILGESETTAGVMVTYSPNNTNAHFTTDGQVVDFVPFDLGSVELLLSQGSSCLMATVRVEQDDVLRAGEQRYPTDVSMTQRNILFAGNQIVGVGLDGALLRSADGVHWTQFGRIGREHLYDVIWTGSQFVAVGSEGAIYTSGDAITWNKNKTFTTETLQAVCWNGSMLVVVGDKGTVLTAKGINLGYGESWYKRVTTMMDSFYDVTWFNHLFVAVGSNGAMYTSPDAVTWAARVSNTTRKLSKLASHAGMLVAVGDAGTILLSNNGIDWAVQSSGTAKNLRGVQWVNQQFMVVGWQENPGFILTSTDGVSWSHVLDNVSNGFFMDITWAGKEYVVIGFNSLLTSPNGTVWKDWVDYDLPQDERVYVPYMMAVAYGGAKYYSAGYDVNSEYMGESGGVPMYYTTYSGNIWSTSTFQLRVNATKNSGLHVFSIYDITHNGSGFVAVGEGGEILSSIYGDNWLEENFGSTHRYTDPEVDLYAVCWNGQQYLAVGEKGAVRTSPNGTVWTQQFSGVTVNLRDVLWNGSQYVAVGDTGTIVTSADGLTWHIRASGVSEHLEAVSWNGSVWVAVGGTYPTKGVLLYSTDGESWTPVSPTNADRLNTKWIKSICWNGKQFLAGGVSGRVYTSPDGITWTAHLSSYSTMSDLIYDGSRYVASTWSSVILTSSDGLRWTSFR